MSVALLDRDQLHRLLRERLKTRDWWFFVYEGKGPSAVVEEIEKRFYSGRASIDFELFFMAIPDRPASSIVTARKTRLSAKRLHKLMKDACVSLDRDVAALIENAEFQEQDVLFLSEYDPVGLSEWLFQVYYAVEEG